MAAIVDTCLLIDVTDPASPWHAWSVNTLERLSQDRALLINPVVYAECAVGFESIEAVDALLESLELGFAQLSRDALFLAGNAFLRYRRRGGVKTGVLSDFFIGAHAAVDAHQVVTRDTRRFAFYFPTIELIIPDRPV